jgi:hypothetical protein
VAADGLVSAINGIGSNTAERDGVTVTLLKNLNTNSTPLAIPAGVTLNTDEYTLTVTAALTVNGEVSVGTAAEPGGMLVVGQDAPSGVITVKDGGALRNFGILQLFTDPVFEDGATIDLGSAGGTAVSSTALIGLGTLIREVDISTHGGWEYHATGDPGEPEEDVNGYFVGTTTSGTRLILGVNTWFIVTSDVESGLIYLPADKTLISEVVTADGTTNKITAMNGSLKVAVVTNAQDVPGGEKVPYLLKVAP